MPFIIPQEFLRMMSFRFLTGFMDKYKENIQQMQKFA